MNIDGIGSSVVVALAAALWFIYLVPTWLRRREYLATERNAVRLQQTLRIMAETAEVPHEVRAEATAREVARQERALREQLARTAEGRSARTARRLRRSRLVASSVLLIALVVAAFGVNTLLTTGDAVMLVSSSAVAVGAFLALGQLASVARERARAMRATAAPVSAQPLVDMPLETASDDRSWTPVPLPKPLYLSHPAPAITLAPAAESAERERAADAAVAELRQAAERSERALREAQASVPRIGARQASPARASATAEPSRFARMGILDEVEAAPADIDEILRRRRAV